MGQASVRVCVFLQTVQKLLKKLKAMSALLDLCVEVVSPYNNWTGIQIYTLEKLAELKQHNAETSIYLLCLILFCIFIARLCNSVFKKGQ